jgi:hypothetical protein
MMTCLRKNPEIVEVGCMAHARCYFKEAADGGGLVRAGVGDHRELYGIERAASDRHLDAPARQRLRQEQARPIVQNCKRSWKSSRRRRYRRVRKAQPSATRCATGSP